MKDLVLCFHVVFKTLNLEIKVSRCYLTDYVNSLVLKRVLHVQDDYFSSFNQSDYCFSGVVVVVAVDLA